MKIQTTKIYKTVDKAIKSGYTIVSAQGSSRSSKTYNILIWLIDYAVRTPKTKISIVRNTLPAIRGSVYEDFLEIAGKLGLQPYYVESKSTFTYTFGNNSKIEFFSASDEQKLRGRKRDVLFVNEANELTFLQWQQLKMRTRRLTIIDYNPSFSDDHWICDVNRDKRAYHFISTYKQNPFLEKVIVEEIESLQWKNKTLWQVYGLGLQAVIEGLIFKGIEIVNEVPSHIRKRFTGLDFGFTNDPTSIVDVAIDGNTLYLDEICYKTQMLTSDIVRELKEKCQTRKIISESADPRLVKEIYRAGLNVHPVKKYGGSVEAGILKMLEFKICVTARSTNTIKEFKNYTYQQDKEGKWLNAPIDAFNHSIDAIRYVILEEVLGGYKRPIDLNRLAKNV